MDNVMNKIYQKLEKEMIKRHPEIDKLIFLTGAVQALRVVNNFEVPEIELAFLKIRRVYGKGVEKCL